VRNKMESERLQRELQERERWQQVQEEQARWEEERTQAEERRREEVMARREAEAVAANAADRFISAVQAGQGGGRNASDARDAANAAALLRPLQSHLATDSGVAAVRYLREELAAVQPTQLVSLVGLGRALLRLQAEAEQLGNERAAAVNARDFARAQSAKEQLDRALGQSEVLERRCGQARLAARRLELISEALAQVLHASVERHEYVRVLLTSAFSFVQLLTAPRLLVSLSLIYLFAD
jgi:hypothetical protein